MINSKKRRNITSEKQQFKYFVGCIPKNLTPLQLKNFFSSFVAVERFDLEMRTTGANKGYGVLVTTSEFPSSRFNDIVYEGSTLKIDHLLDTLSLKKKKNDELSRKLSVKGLRYSHWNLEKFTEAMSRFGRVERALLNKPPEGTKCVYISGTVVFETEAQAKDAKVEIPKLIYKAEAFFFWDVGYRRKRAIKTKTNQNPTPYLFASIRTKGNLVKVIKKKGQIEMNHYPLNLKQSRSWKNCFQGQN